MTTTPHSSIRGILAGAIARSLAFLLVLSVALRAAAQSPPGATEPVAGVISVGLVVSDLDRLCAFYTGTLGFRRVDVTEATGDATDRLAGVFGVRRRTARLALGDELLELTQYLSPEGRPIPPDSRSHDRWFQHVAIVVSDLDRAYAHLRSHDVRHASSGPQTLPDWNPGAGGISAFYFKDPDGHILELIEYPAGKGDPKWQRPGGALFLGIDHTAIVVADTETSLAFYSDLLGLRVAGTSENYGPEQEHLNGVFGARLRITSLRAADGPGMELLEYLSPSDGRDYPTEARACDLLSWTTHFRVADTARWAARLDRARARWVSPGLVTSLADSGWSRAVSLRDPDGHLLILGEPVSPTASDPPDHERLPRR